MKNVLIIFGLLLLLVVAFYITQQSVNGGAFTILGIGKSSKVIIKEHTFSVTVADTNDEKAKGLSGKKSLPKDSGMLFLFDPKESPAFWMKDMQFPIDIVFISDGTVVTVYKNVPLPSSTGQNLPLYKPTQPVDDVLEINAGLSEQYGIKEGDSVKITL